MRRSWLVILVTAALAVFAAACGGDDDSGNGGSNDPTGIQAGEGARAERAEQAGQQAAEDAGGQVDLPQQKAGILQILGSIESAQRSERAMKNAISALGWTSTVCDAQGDPTKMARCGDSLLDQDVDVMFVLGIEPALIKAQMRKAKGQDVPVIGFGGQVADDPLWAGKYYPNDPLSGELLTEYVLERLGETEGDKQVAVNTYPADWSRLRTNVFVDEIKDETSFEVVANQTTDAANLVEGTRKQVNDTLTANPELDVYWFGFNTAGQVGAQAIATKYPGKEFPDRPLVVTFDADLGTQELMRSGAIDAVADVPYDASAWVAADQAAQFFARQTPFAREAQPDYPIEIFDNKIVTKDNLPPEGEYREPKDDFVTFFKTKWGAEFGGGS